MLKKLFLALCGTIAGFLNGLLGTGGGIAIIYTLNRLFPEEDPKDNFATSVSAMLPMSVVSAGSYLSAGSFVLGDALVYIPSAVVGGVLGALFLCRIKTGLLKKIFACVVIYAGVNMML